MTTIRLSSWVDAPVERCFLLATSKTLAFSDAGAGGGSLREGDALSWRMRVAGRWLSFTSRVDLCRSCSHFREVMSSRLFRYYEHDHYFATMDDGTRVRDEVRFQTGMGALGTLLGFWLKRSLRKRLLAQQERLKRIAESADWQRYLDPEGAERAGLERMVLPENSPQAASMQRFA